jgi:hypothetical protein
MARVDKSSARGCWIWTGGKLSNGYGLIRIDRGSHTVVHRLSYEHYIGPIPDGLQLDHLCRNRACVNPEHLEPVTCQENTLRGVGPAAQNATKTHCPAGHEYTPENTYSKPSKPANRSRDCRTCRKARDRQRYLARKEAA